MVEASIDAQYRARLVERLVAITGGAWIGGWAFIRLLAFLFLVAVNDAIGPHWLRVTLMIAGVLGCINLRLAAIGAWWILYGERPSQVAKSSNPVEMWLNEPGKAKLLAAVLDPSPQADSFRLVQITPEEASKIIDEVMVLGGGPDMTIKCALVKWNKLVSSHPSG